jgi:hypothetical protein
MAGKSGGGRIFGHRSGQVCWLSACRVCYNAGMTVSIHTHLRSDTIHLPEVAGLVGKDVRIIVMEEPVNRSPRDLSVLDRLAGKIDLDYDAIDDLRQRSVA